MSSRSRADFDRLVPVSDRYATLPVDEAFNWADVLDSVDPGEWYMVAFRSIRRSEADEAKLKAHDDWAHLEANGAPGFVHYFKGPTTPGGQCMSFCLWNSRAEARTAAGRPAHAAAAALTHEAYATYTLEFHRVSRLAGNAGFTFEPYDTPPDPTHAEPPLTLGLTPKLAPS